MTHTSTDQPEALRLADNLEANRCHQAARELRRLHARVQELEASQARVPLSDDVLRDAARYRFLAGHCRSTSEHWGGHWSIIVDGPAPKSHDSEDDFDAAIDAAQAKHGEPKP